jgi:hypothetical protein
MENKPTPEQGDKKDCCSSKGCGCLGGKCCYVAAVAGVIVLLLIGGVLGFLLGRCGGKACGPKGCGPKAGMAAHKMCCDKPGMGMGMGAGAECPMMGDATAAPAEKTDKK